MAAGIHVENNIICLRQQSLLNPVNKFVISDTDGKFVTNVPVCYKKSTSN